MNDIEQKKNSHKWHKKFKPTKKEIINLKNYEHDINKLHTELIDNIELKKNDSPPKFIEFLYEKPAKNSFVLSPFLNELIFKTPENFYKKHLTPKKTSEFKTYQQEEEFKIDEIPRYKK